MSAINEHKEFATRDDVTELSKKIDNFLFSASNNLDHHFKNLDVRFNELGKKIDSTNNRLDHLEIKIERQFFEIEKKLSKIEAKVNILWILGGSTLIGIIKLVFWH